MIQHSNKNQYDLSERTAVFGENIIRFCKSISQNSISRPLVSQLIRSGTSVGANYAEANGASSKKDFRNKIFICKKECEETKYWIRMVVNTNPEIRNWAIILYRETQELTMIFQKIVNSLNNKKIDNCEIDTFNEN